MNIVLWILVGVVIGWLIEWVIDWLFWRRDGSHLQEKLNQAETELQRLKAQPDAKKLQAELAELQQQLSAARQEIDTYQAKQAEADRTIESLQAELAKQRQQIPETEDPLEEIKGIGAVFARRLKAAGITTFDQLGRTPATRIREIIQPEEWQKIEPDHWIAQAKEMAAKKAVKASNKET